MTIGLVCARRVVIPAAARSHPERLVGKDKLRRYNPGRLYEASSANKIACFTSAQRCAGRNTRLFYSCEIRLAMKYR